MRVREGCQYHQGLCLLAAEDTTNYTTFTKMNSATENSLRLRSSKFGYNILEVILGRKVLFIGIPARLINNEVFYEARFNGDAFNPHVN